MGLFSNYKINSLRKKIIEDNYELRLEKLALTLDSFDENKKQQLGIMIQIASMANYFAKIMICYMFHPNTGVFKRDTINLNEKNFKDLYEVIAIWYSWTKIESDSEGNRDQKLVDFYIRLLEICLNINKSKIIIYYSGLEDNENLENFALYRWCMLTVGHIDENYETMHENSPDCLEFINLIEEYIEEADKIYGGNVKR